MRAAIWRNTLVTAAVYALLIAAAERLIQARIPLAREMTLALAFAAVQIVAIIVIVAVLFARKQWNVVRAARSQRVVPHVQEALALHSIGIDQRQRIDELRRQAPDDVRETLFAMLASTRGEPRDRMAALTADLGFAERRRQGTLDWARNVIRLRRGEAFEEIVAAVAHQSLLVRAIAAEELAPYAAEISEPAIAHGLESADLAVIVTTLDMLRAWRRAIEIPGVVRLLDHADGRVRRRALLVLPYAAAGAPPESLAPGVLAALDDQNGGVRQAAALAAGRLGLGNAVQALAAHLTDPDRHVAVAAAFALAALGDRGNAVLERAVLSRDRAAAAAAFEAMEKRALGLAELA